MTAPAVIPPCVVPPAAQVADYHRIAHALAVRTSDVGMRGHAATLNWVTGGQAAPMTERADAPTEAVMRAEMMVAARAAAGLAVPAGMWAGLGVTPARAVTDSQPWATAVGLALGWLLGVHRSALRLPRRNPDGTVMTAEQLYLEAREQHPGRWVREQADAARAKAGEEAALYRRLADLAAPVR